MVQDDQHASVKIDAEVFQPDVALQTLLRELIAPVLIDPPNLMRDNLDNAVKPQSAMSKNSDPVCSAAYQEKPFVKTSLFYGSVSVVVPVR